MNKIMEGYVKTIRELDGKEFGERVDELTIPKNIQKKLEDIINGYIKDMQESLSNEFISLNRNIETSYPKGDHIKFIKDHAIKMVKKLDLGW